MLGEGAQELRRALILGLLITVVLLATACRSLATPDSPEPETTRSVESTPSPVLSKAEGIGEGPPSASLGTGRTSSAQHLRFERISLEQGLSQSVVYCILEDRQGFIWFGTGDGLNKYDGYRFTVYKQDPEDPNSLSDSSIPALLEDRYGVLWVGTDGGGLNRFDRETGQYISYQHNPSDPHSLSHNRIQSLFEDRSGTIWIGTEGGGLNRYDWEKEQFVHYQNDPQNPQSLSSNDVQAIYEDNSGVLWIGTSGGLNRFDREKEQFIHYLHDPDDLHSLSGDTVLSIYEDRSGVLWIGTSGGLNRFDREKEQFARYENDPDDPHSLSNNSVSAIYEDEWGVLWIGTEEGLNQFDREREQFVRYRSSSYDPHSLSNDRILSVYEDRSGVLWVGTLGGGLSTLTMRTKGFVHYLNDPDDPNSLSGNIVFPIIEDHTGMLWIGTIGRGLNRFDRKTGQFVHYLDDPEDPNSLSSNDIWSLHEDSECELWVGTYLGGLHRFDREKEQFVRYQSDPDDPHSLSNNSIHNICEDSSGDLWVATSGGLNRFDPDTEQFIRYVHDPSDPHGLNHDKVYSVHQDRTGILWAGTRAGLDRFDREKEQFVHYQHDPGDPHSLSGNDVLSIDEDRSGVLWIGTWGGGLNKFDRENESFTHYREKDGLPNDVVYGVLEDDQGYLWISTNRGLSKFDPRTETFRNYDVSDGLQSNEFNSNAYFKSQSGEMFFGGINGINAFHPEDIEDNPYAPPVVVTAFSLFNEVVGADLPPEARIELSHQQNFVSFDFAALDYNAPEKNQYAYMMEGLDRDWVYVGTRRHADYPNLPPGEYVFRVKGSNNDGIWNEEGTSVLITIKPPFWATWWFRGIVLLVLIGGAIGSYRLRVRSMETRSRELEKQVMNRTKELAALNAIAATVSRSLDLDEVLNGALDKTLQVMEIEAGGIYLLDEEAGVLTVAAQRGFSPEFVAGIDRLEVGEGFSGRVAQSGQPMLVRNISTDPRLSRMVVRDAGLRSAAIVPLSSKGEVLGTMFAITRGYREFSDQDVQLLTSIGDQIGVAVENARLYEQAQQVAVVEERQRLARELHDSVTQALYGVTLYSEAAAGHLALGHMDRATEHLQELQGTAQEALAEMRLLIFELRPPILEELGLVATLQARLQAVEGRAGLRTEFKTNLEERLPPDVEEGLYRIALEALNNALKHAQARNIKVHLRQDEPGRTEPARLTLEIADDGVGFDLAAARERGGLGLSAMEERAVELGGRLNVESAPGSGTRIRAVWTIDERGEPNE